MKKFPKHWNYLLTLKMKKLIKMIKRRKRKMTKKLRNAKVDDKIEKPVKLVIPDELKDKHPRNWYMDLK